MSDFDEEAERERLREQYEREQEKREATEHMSELLLKGATMTDGHCEQCGDPIFRYDGQEFCPTCQQPVAAVDGEEDATGDTEAAQATQEPHEPGQSDQTPTDADRDEPDVPTDDSEATTTPDDEPSTSDVEATSSERVEVPTVAPDSDAGPTAPVSNRDNDLGAAREALVATLTRFARQAEATEDPRRAVDALGAAREAAEALAAFEDIR